ncbi:MAG: PAS domain S-box protein [Rhodocyclaceae bacterium]|nr:PAS domain S-box protein [Rhodocyclaceae bacterium]
MSIKFSDRLLDELPDALIVADLKGVIRVWNTRAEELFKFSKAAVIGESLDLIIPENLRKSHWAGFCRAISSGKVKFNGKPVRTKALLGDGGLSYVNITFSLSHDEEGNTIGVAALARVAPKE